MRHAACAVAQHAATEKLAIRRLLAAREAERRQRAETRIGESERHCAAGAEHQKAWLSRTGVGQGEGTGSLKGVFARGGLNGATRVGGLSSPQKREREREREREWGPKRAEGTAHGFLQPRQCSSRGRGGERCSRNQGAEKRTAALPRHLRPSVLQLGGPGSPGWALGEWRLMTDALRVQVARR